MGKSQFQGRCRCNQTDRTFKDFRDTASWRETIHNETTFAARFATNEHPLVQCIVRCGMHMWGLDGLHVVDYNGVSAHAIGNFLTDLVRGVEVAGCRFQGDVFRYLNEHLRNYYNRTKETDRIGEHSCDRIRCRTYVRT